jgi:anti-sigma factor RsiW
LPPTSRAEQRGRALLSCEEVRAELSNLADDEVTAAARRELERHLAECHACEVLYDSTRKTIRIVTDAGAFALPDDVSKRLLDRIREAMSRDDPSRPA